MYHDLTRHDSSGVFEAVIARIERQRALGHRRRVRRIRRWIYLRALRQAWSDVKGGLLFLACVGVWAALVVTRIYEWVLR